MPTRLQAEAGDRAEQSTDARRPSDLRLFEADRFRQPMDGERRERVHSRVTRIEGGGRRRYEGARIVELGNDAELAVALRT